jgi:tetratricopeptide (TPR) repeat protein
MLKADLIVGLLSMRKYEDAWDILNEIDIKYLPKWDGSLLIYYNNEMSLYFNTGEIDKAKEIYETKIKNYPIKILNESLTMDLILANKSFYEKEYNSSKELFSKVLQNNKSKRLKLEVYYILANIAEQEGNIEEAIQKYKTVAEEGNKLYSAYLARGKLKTLSIS